MIDIIFDDTDTLLGAFESTRKHQEDIVTHHKGWNKFKPSLGVGIADFIGEEIRGEEIKAAISHEFRNDGQKVNQIVINSSGKLIVDANY